MSYITGWVWLKLVLILFVSPLLKWQSFSHQAKIQELESSKKLQQQQYEEEIRSSNTELGRLRRDLEESEGKAGEGDKLVLQYKHTVEGLKEDLVRTQQLHKSAMDQVLFNV